jgi:HNH endonuclease/NUMOD4 motif
MTQASSISHRVDLTNEVWVIVPGFPAYEVSNQGGVRRRVAKGRWSAGHVLRPGTAKSGHRYVMLADPGGRTHKKFVHRLVALAFIGPPPHEGALVLHHDDRAHNNYVDNLYWGDARQNARDRKLNRELPSEVSQRGAQPGGANASAVLTESDVLEIRRYLEIGLCGACIARLYGVRKETVYSIAKGRTWSHTGRAQV